MPREQCPCCDYISLPERNNYLICPICFWEDDGIDVDRLDVHSGPNQMTLRTGRANFQRIGACDEEMLVNVLPAAERDAFEHRSRSL
ncbi:CPCC family cysteine-rich protein [Aeoliella mucimassa]